MNDKHWGRLRRAAAVIWIVWSFAGVRALAAGEELIPVGEPVGVEVAVDGVLVAGVSRIGADGAASPAEAAGLRAGDVITALNGAAVDSAEELARSVALLPETPAELTVTRNGRQLCVRVEPAPASESGQRLGLWLRDSVTGIGTVTYIDPETGAFGALGHGVNDVRSGTLLPVTGGSVCRAQIVDVQRGAAGAPGELAGSFSTSDAVGRIEKNTGRGVFGVMTSPADWGGVPVPVAAPEDVIAGPAVIRTCVSGREAREYRVEIARAGVMSGEGRDLTIRVTDPELLALTGGIVQGMSGSPILQNGMLVGAVTHVLTGDPTRGYGVYAVNMLREAA